MFSKKFKLAEQKLETEQEELKYKDKRKEREMESLCVILLHE